MLTEEFGLSRRQAYRYLQEAQAIKRPVPIVAPSVAMTVKLPEDIATKPAPARGWPCGPRVPAATASSSSRGSATLFSPRSGSARQRSARALRWLPRAPSLRRARTASRRQSREQSARLLRQHPGSCEICRAGRHDGQTPSKRILRPRRIQCPLRRLPEARRLSDFRR